MKAHYSKLTPCTENTDFVSNSSDFRESQSRSETKTIEIVNHSESTMKKQINFFGLHSAKFFGFLAFCSLMFQHVAFGQVASYTQATSVGTYTAITGTTWQTGTAINTNAVSAAIPLGFTFRYNHKDYTNIFISNNGFIAFADDPINLPNATNVTPISNHPVSGVTVKDYYDGAISGFGCDVIASTYSGAVSTIIYGTSGADFVVQYTDIERSVCSNIERLSFQIRLTPSTNVIKIVYGGTISGTCSQLQQYPQVGLRGASYRDWKNLSAFAGTTAWSNPTVNNSVGTAGSTSTIAFKVGSWMAVGQTYTFTPPAQLGTPGYATLPATTDFTTWTNGLNTGDLPGVNWRTWPTYGDRSWRINTVSAGTGNGWTAIGSGPTVAPPATGTFARLQSTYMMAKGYMDYYVNFSPVGTKVLTFDYINNDIGTVGTNIVKIYLSTDGGATFGSALLTTGDATSWATQSITLGSSTSSTCVVRFEGKGDYGNDDIGIDNVNISVPSAPTIASFAPTSLCASGGQTVVITGANFTGVTAVNFNNVAAASYVVNSSTQITAVTPSPLTAGVITVTNAVGIGSSTSYTLASAVAASVSITASPTTICAGTSVTFTATPTNGGTTPSYQWKLNGANVGSNSATYTNASLANGNVVSCVMTSNLTSCVTGSPATSNAITMVVNPSLTASVSIAASATTICAGTSVTFTATPTNGGTAPSYQWLLNGANVGSNSATYTNATLANGNVVTCVMTSNLTACLTGSPATSNGVTMTVSASGVAASVSIAASATTICAGTSVTFTATPTNGGTAPSYQWLLNGANVGTNSATYTNASLANGNVVTCVLTSNATPCVTGSPATSNAVSMVVNPNLTASVSIAASASTICAGTSVTFTATPTNGGTTPAYQWLLNGSNIGSNSATYTTASLANGDIVTCVLTSNATLCLSGSPATSNGVTMTVSASGVAASVSIAATATSICAGTTVTFTATPTNGGTSPSYQWLLNGTNVGTNATSYTNATLANGDIVTCVLTSNATPCVTGSPATSNAVTMTVNPNLTASVSIAATATTIVAGTSVTFTATPTNGGAAPVYQWKLNGTNVGTNSATYTNTALANGDIVSCVLTSNATPCLTGSPATSNAVTMTVTPNGTSGIISVSCAEESNGMHVFPNPTKGDFTVEISANQNLNGSELVIIDLTGKIVSKRDIHVLQGKTQTIFQNQELQLGTYIIQLISLNDNIKPVRLFVD